MPVGHTSDAKKNTSERLTMPVPRSLRYGWLKNFLPHSLDSILVIICVCV